MNKATEIHFELQGRYHPATQNARRLGGTSIIDRDEDEEDEDDEAVEVLDMFHPTIPYDIPPSHMTLDYPEDDEPGVGDDGEDDRVAVEDEEEGEEGQGHGEEDIGSEEGTTTSATAGGAPDPFGGEDGAGMRRFGRVGATMRSTMLSQ